MGLHICLIIRKINKHDYPIFQKGKWSAQRHQTCPHTTITPADLFDLVHIPALKEISKSNSLLYSELALQNVIEP